MKLSTREEENFIASQDVEKESTTSKKERIVQSLENKLFRGFHVEYSAIKRIVEILIFNWSKIHSSTFSQWEN